MIKHIKLYAVLAFALICSSLAGHGLTTTKFTLSSLSPTQVVAGSGNFVLTLTGTQFKRGMQVAFGSVMLSPSYLDSKVIRATVPSSAITNSGPVNVYVVKLDNQPGESNALSFLVTNPIPSISQLMPSSVTVVVSGTQHPMLTIVGSRFVEGATVSVKDIPVSPKSVQPEAITVNLPSEYLQEAGTLPISVTNPAPGGGTSNVIDLVVRGRATTSWSTVANNKTGIPETTKLFNSYNQPSVNTAGMVVFKGQSKGESGPTVGIYTRDMSGPQSPVKVTDNSTPVPDPNNTSYNGKLATFIQFPSFPRIDQNTSTLAFRGQSQPVYTYTLSDGTDTKIGSTGIFTNPTGVLATGASLLGVAPGFEYFQVPGVSPGTRFDQFPGSPAVTDNSKIVFKGNYTVGTVGKTGVFYRDMSLDDGKAPIELIADSSTLIPGQPEGGVTFGSTAPPSAANGTAVFVGLDNEANPSMGGIYEAQLTHLPALDTLVSLGTHVPGEPDNATFNRLGEGLSFDGRYVAFWGAWGTGMKSRLLLCPTDGNASVIAACNAMHPNGYQAQVPVHQGVFVYDRDTKALYPIAKTPGEFDDFVYWVFSGRPPSTGDSDGGDVAEPPRWRSSAFIAVAGQGTGLFGITFKAQINPIDGVYVAQGPGPAPILTVLDTATPGQSVDPESPDGSSVATVGMERDGLRGSWLVVTSSMLNADTTESNAGIYITPLTLQ